MNVRSKYRGYLLLNVAKVVARALLSIIYTRRLYNSGIYSAVRGCCMIGSGVSCLQEGSENQLARGQRRRQQTGQRALVG